MVLGISFYSATFILRDNPPFGFRIPQKGRTSYDEWNWGNYTRHEGRVNYYEVSSRTPEQRDKFLIITCEN